MEFVSVSLTDWIQLIFMVVAGAYAIYLLYKSNREKRNRLVLEILDRLLENPDIKIILYQVDKGNNLDEIKFGGNLEEQADKTLKYLDYIGHLLKHRDLKKSDISIFKYEITRILENSSIQNYIKWLRSIGLNLENLDRLDYLINS